MSGAMVAAWLLESNSGKVQSGFLSGKTGIGLLAEARHEGGDAGCAPHLHDERSRPALDIDALPRPQCHRSLACRPANGHTATKDKNRRLAASGVDRPT